MRASSICDIVLAVWLLPLSQTVAQVVQRENDWQSIEASRAGMFGNSVQGGCDGVCEPQEGPVTAIMNMWENVDASPIPERPEMTDIDLVPPGKQTGNAFSFTSRGSAEAGVGAPTVWSPQLTGCGDHSRSYSQAVASEPVSAESSQLASQAPEVLEEFSLREADEEGDLHNETEFLPFDEWKRIKLDEEKRASVHSETHTRTRIPVDYNRADALGDEMEIDVGMFTSMEDDEPEGKLYHEKFNYASLDCAASIVKTNSEAQGASSILYENKDKYLLNPCSAVNKFVVIELCQDILVEEIEMANYEFFSSTFQNVRFSVSDRFPVPKNGWKVLGEFTAVNSRDIQKFGIPNPKIWARYLRVEILSHYGNEFYCPISVVRTHGKTMMEEFKLAQSVGNSQESEVLQPAPDRILNSTLHNASFLCTGSHHNNNGGPLSFSSNNVSVELFADDMASQCRAALPPLRFEEFIDGFDDISCGQKHSKSMNFTGTISNSATEESIFKNIMKRLTTLETNATLSILYIEEQSRLLSKSFYSLEKNHAKKFDSLVSIFNETMMHNLETLNVFAKQLKDSSMHLLEEQKLSTDQFTSMTIQRLDMMERDARFQKRMVYLILVAVAALLVYVLLTREAYIDDYMEDDGWYLDSPPLQKAKDKLMRKAARAVSTPTIFKNFQDDIAPMKIRRNPSFSSSSSISDVSQYLIDNDDDSVFLGRPRTYSKLLAADENEIDIDEIMTHSSDNSDVSHGMDRLLDADGTEVSSRESSDGEPK
ncbi:AFR673Cp [Eremothecium gossypii ATCC 10895]|uniref:SUN-like protein 1 n=1 Tax=Eremothecium gossypii (strain ATCC 10895 / CBS 109.51 / FGSC 9923 / NRRL Y-1056) TaxID=284811 RepID=Q752A2_EREGS|nr:AFR673Cp [Eremothecium gossypii ATCC 10895]AAS54045.1 AFR673Cp [Eremothecium gossypii ATCC 10895]AEY98360.1 FAFR673Cp [Eremothecium gossypii FDAG1]